MSSVDAAIHCAHENGRLQVNRYPYFWYLLVAITMFETIIQENAYLKGKKELKEDGKYLLIY